MIPGEGNGRAPYSARPAFSKEARILAYSLQGLHPGVIAVLVGSSLRSVRVQQSRLRKAGHRIPRHSDFGMPLLPLPLHERLSMEAARRGMPPQGLVAMLLWTIIEDDLFDAVLDEREGDVDEAA